MGLFFDVLSAVNNPNQNASVDQLSSVAGTVQQLASQHGVEPSAMQGILSGLGGAMRPALQQQATGGGLGDLMGQLASSQLTGGGGGLGNMGGLAAMITPQLIQGLSQKTGVNSGALQSMLPALIPVVMQFLNMGASKTGGSAAGLADNPLLKSFLDGDRDGDVDLGDVFKFTGRFLNPAR
ncbi:MAG: DUF937 domain-containing protein [Pegethrix bostrychoides GSE-TBD4-15B]|jgi:hypothetical protein|uniref:DUF937 domain-containing protein n=1 Tax=Pegethrix bostrychoides GSE-TBD4-15B TaxID=2839662 RepID=A0A951U4A4_9CYAN|nr:DUF937 domain-containing protein [Pegethrix bostrychoides GSE-TBD4-15B]